MVSLTRRKSGEWFARKGIPEDVRPAYAKAHGVQWEAMLRLPAATTPALAKARFGEWLAEVETQIAQIRATAIGEGLPLTVMNALALAGRWRTWFIEGHLSDLRTPEHWAARKDHYIWNVLEPHAPDEHHEPDSDASWPWLREPRVRAAVAPQVREMALTASFLASERLVLSAEAEALFVGAVSDWLADAYDTLEQRASGDFTPDVTPQSFPAFRECQGASSGGMACWELFGAYVAAVKPAAGTVGRWRAVFKDLQVVFEGRSTDSLSEADAQTWVDKLVTPRRSAVTIDAVWITAARTVFGWAVKRKINRVNPFSEVHFDVKRAPVLRETKAFTADEAAIILRAASSITDTRGAFAGAKRWVMWLCAYTGARAGEITQLRGMDVTARGALHVLRITPEAGTTKTNDAHTVPLHEHLIAQGFLQFVRERGDGPLFVNAKGADTVGTDTLNPKMSAAAKTRGRLGVWVRSLGVDDPGVSPTHGWRHTFKQTAERAGISERISDKITNHAAKTMGRSYGPATVEDMAKALEKFPRYDVVSRTDGK